MELEVLSAKDMEPEIAPVLLRRMAALEAKFSSQLAHVQQQGFLQIRENVAKEAAEVAKDAAMAEFSQIVKGVSEVLHSQLRRMDHLEAQWRELERGLRTEAPPAAVEARRSEALHGRLLELEELLERSCAHEEALAAEVLQISARLSELEPGAAALGQLAGLEVLVSSTAQSAQLLQQDSHEFRQRIEAMEQRSYHMRAWQDAKEEHYRCMVERFERMNVESRLKELQSQMREQALAVQQQGESLQLLEQRVEGWEAQAAARPPRLGTWQQKLQLEQRLQQAELRLEACQTSLDTVNSCLAGLEKTFLQHFPGPGGSGEDTPRPKPRRLPQSPETETLRNQLPGATSEAE
ncbi:unnamed protein product [Effrenium voratum]|nr:unnamed protein product [Effrenium voratum]